MARIRHGFLWLSLCLLALGCTTNPATGKRQLNMFSEAQEIAMGREADQQIVAQYGLVDDEELQRYVSDLGQRLAAQSERPHLPWTFRVVDDPVVNAFALPGGFVYITRGILGTLSSEAELVGVLGHEIGHVTARHGVNQLTKQQLAGVGLIAGAIASPEAARQFGGLVQSGVGLAFLKFGRDDERQADELGFRYMSRTGHPPAALPEVFSVLGAAGELAGAGRLPNWLSTHPAPEDRRQRTAARLSTLPPELANADWRREPYFERIDGLAFGPNPREGFFRGTTFYHPELAFQVDFPEGWTTQNQRQAVVAMSPEKDAILALTLVEGDRPEPAAQTFLSQQGIEAGNRWLRNAHGLDTSSNVFRFMGQDGAEQLRGGAAFTHYDGRVYRLLGYTRPDDWRQRDVPLRRAAASFERLTDRRLLAVEPQRIAFVTLRRPMTIEAFDEAYPSDVPIGQLALINHVRQGEQMPAGTRVKRVLGTNPARP